LVKRERERGRGGEGGNEKVTRVERIYTCQPNRQSRRSLLIMSMLEDVHDPGQASNRFDGFAVLKRDKFNHLKL
jgi:hypothetical protein